MSVDIDTEIEIIKIIIKHLFVNKKDIEQIYNKFILFLENNESTKQRPIKLLEKFIEKNVELVSISKLKEITNICKNFGIDFNPNVNLLSFDTSVMSKTTLHRKRYRKENINLIIEEYLKNIPIKDEDKKLFKEISSNIVDFNREYTNLYILAIILLCFELNGRVFKLIRDYDLLDEVNKIKNIIKKELKKKGFNLNPRYKDTKEHWIDDTIDNFYYFINDKKYKKDLDNLIKNILDFLKDPETGEYIDFLNDVTKYPCLIGILAKNIVNFYYSEDFKNIVNNKLEWIIGLKQDKTWIRNIKKCIKENFKFIPIIHLHVHVYRVPYITKELINIIEDYKLRYFTFDPNTLEHRIFKKLIKFYNLKIKEISTNNEGKFIYLIYFPYSNLSYENLEKLLLKIYNKNVNVVCI